MCAWCFTFFLTGCTFLATAGVPDLKHFLEEEIHYVETSCRLISANKTGPRACTEGKRESQFQCLRVLASYEDSNSSIIIAEMFRSNKDAKETDFECSAYECTEPAEIDEYFREVNESESFQCFYHPDRLEYVYFDTENHSLVIFLFVLYVLLIVMPLALLCVCTLCYSKEHEVLCFKNRLHRSNDYYITKSLKNGSYRNCKQLVKETNVNEKVYIDGMGLAPLAAATKYGRIKIMDYLEEGIFHLACKSENEEAIGWCLDKKLSINQLDAENRTPLSTYLRNFSSPSLPLLKRMIDEGADVKTMDINNWTPLHFACMNKNINHTEINSQVIALLIKSGSISHQVIQEMSNPADKWTPFTSLLQLKEYSLCLLLIEAGYPLRKDNALVYVTDLPSDIQHALTEEVQNPSSLLRMCRFGIRNIFEGIRVQKNLELLPLPQILIQFLKLDENNKVVAHNDGTFYAS